LRLAKFEYRISKFETNSKSQIQMSKTIANLSPVDSCFEFRTFEFLVCFGFRASDFGFSISPHIAKTLHISILSSGGESDV